MRSAFAGCVLALLAAGCASMMAPNPKAAATLGATKGSSASGGVTFEQRGDKVVVTAKVSGLSPGGHGFHIHEKGDCSSDDGMSAGGHFNPDGKRHGWMNPAGLHAGDLPNLIVGPDGSGRAEFYAPRVTLGAGSQSLFQPDGTALVIHAGPDDEATDPAGNSGDRIACGVITR